jgi:succinate-acetate transporter protein
MKRQLYNPLGFGLIAYGLGILPLALYLIGVLPVQSLMFVLVHGFIVAGIGQILTSFLLKRFFAKKDSMLFLLYGFHWTMTFLLDMLSYMGLLQFKYYSLFPFATIAITLAFMLPFAMQHSLANTLTYAFTLAAFLLHITTMFNYETFATATGMFYLASITCALYVGVSECVYEYTGRRVFPLGEPVLGTSSGPLRYPGAASEPSMLDAIES